MNNQDRIELELVRNRQLRLSQDLDALAHRIGVLEGRLARERAAEAVAMEGSMPPPIPEMPGEIASPGLPPIIQPEQQAAPSVAALEMPSAPPGPPAFTFQQISTEEPPAIEPSPVAAVHRSAESAAPESFEMRLGTYWFVRIGVVLLLTALAFLGNFAYQKFVFKMGPAGKVALMYVASAALLGAGAWLQRREAKETLKNYAQVVFAGGLAAVYFTTYAAHHIERLRVISSASLDGLLLLGLAGFIVWIADRKKSELVALFALGLAYYTSAITRTGAFTLYSNLLLAAATVFFLHRNRWAVLSAISLSATYAGYAFWRFYALGEWRFPNPEEGLLFSAAFLGAYWLVFTSAVFLSTHENFKGANRALFLTGNNGAALALFLLTMMQLQTGGVWKVFLGFGTALLCLSWLARKLLPSDEPSRVAYLTQGLALATGGIIMKYEGSTLALMLACESVVIFALGCRLQNVWLRAGGWVTGLLAVASPLEADITMKGTMWTGLGVATAMLVNTIFADRRDSVKGQGVRPEAAYFVVLLVSTLAVLIWTHVERGQLGGIYLATALVLTLSIYLLRIPELSVLSQPLAFLGHASWFANIAARQGPWEPWTQPALILAVTLALSHWWQRQNVLNLGQGGRKFLSGGYALAGVILAMAWLMPHLYEAGLRHHFAAWLAGLLIVFTIYAALTRSAEVALTGQLILVPAIICFIAEVFEKRAPWASLLILPMAIFLLSSAGTAWLRTRPTDMEERCRWVALMTRAYAWGGLALLAMLIASYVPARHCPWVFALLSILPFAWAGFRRGELLPYALALLVCATVAYVSPMKDQVWAYAGNLAFIAVLVAQQRIARRMHSRYELPQALHTAMMIVAGLSLWLFVSRYVQANVTGFLLTATWSVLALGLFAAGMALRERPYRWLGLLVLACSLGRIVLMDVWKLHTIYRILSFMALGVVLVLLGYVYNRFQEKIRQWL